MGDTDNIEKLADIVSLKPAEADTTPPVNESGPAEPDDAAPDARSPLEVFSDEIDSHQEIANAAMVKAWGGDKAAVLKNPRWPEYQGLVASNFKRSELLRVQGVQMNDVSLLQHRMELFIDFLCPIGTPERLEFELQWQQTVCGSLDTIEESVAAQKEAALRQKLLVPQSPGGLYLPDHG